MTVTIRTVCYAISEHLPPKNIHLPQDEPTLDRLIAGWEQKTGFPMVVGAVDGIPIMQPYCKSQDYYSYKMKYTINVQGFCDYNGKFIDVDIRWPGGTHDAKVFSYSSINKHLQEQKQPYLCRTLLPGRDKVGLLLLREIAYLLSPHVIKEFATCTTDAQLIFNQMLRGARNAIECAYGRLKARWTILSVPLNFKLQEVSVIIITCFVLHNWCEEHDVGIDDAAVIDQIQRDQEMQPSRTIDRRYTFTFSEGRKIRDIIKDYFSEQSS